MTTYYPDEIYEHREIENVPKVEYDPTKKLRFYVEDFLALVNEIKAIEETLGINPQSYFESVADRLQNGGYLREINYRVGIGTDHPEGVLHILLHADSGTPSNTFNETVLNTTGGAAMAFRKARGTIEDYPDYLSPALLNDISGGLVAQFWTGKTNVYKSGAAIRFYADENQGDSANGTRIVFQTRANSSGVSGGPTDRMTIKNDGKVGVGTTTPTNLFDINSDSIRIRTAKTPSSASDTGNQGEIAWDSSYIYICIATNTWKRVTIATW